MTPFWTDESSFERTGLTDQAKRDAIENINVLDAYVDYNTDIVGLPLMVRAGRQVINWGESTFFLGGNSVFSPIDVPAIRRPGAEIKEALLPVEALYASLALPYDLSLEAYVGGWDHYKLDVGGTAESTSVMPPIWAQLVTAITSWLEPGLLAVQTSEIVILQLQLTRFRRRLAELLILCWGPAMALAVNYARPITLGQAEIERAQILNTNATTGATLGDTNIMRRGADEDNDDFDDMGVAIRWYSEQLNSTEFGLFYQKYTSRLPYVSSRAATPIVGVGAIGPKDGAFTRQYGIAGCASQDWQVLDLQPGEAGYDAANAVEFVDPLGVGAATNAVAKSIWDQSKAAFGADPT